MAEETKPDILVGIDLGQTCTGVAFNLPSSGNDDVRWIQKWPGRAQANENKVPTILAYPRGHERPMSWGFRADTLVEQNSSSIREWFKTLLDPRTLERQQEHFPQDTTGHDDVKQWYRDYLTFLYDHIKSKMSAELPNFDFASAKVEFLFSVPTTWSPQVVELFREIIGQAGFSGPANARHTVTISLTEPEAAAVHTSTASPGIFGKDDVLLVCDAGGGTTDLSVLQVTDTMIDALSLKQLRQLDVVGGENIGSAAIDYEFEKLARSRLQLANDINPLEIDAEETAWEMARGRDFQNVKCEYGAPDQTPTFSVVVPHLRNSYNSDEACIERGEMRFDQRDLQALFDRQTDKLFKVIDNQLSRLAAKLPNKQVSHLILSGGLGQSAYLQKKLQARYVDSPDVVSNAQGIQVRVAPDPQLAVCKGLVADRMRKLKAGESVLGWRCCRASYGLICRELYSKKNPKHTGRDVVKDPKDRELYVPDCVDWFVQKGTPVSIDTPIAHKFKRKITPGDPRKVFPTRVVVSYLDKENLPYQLETGVEKLCEVDSDLSGIDEAQFRERNKQFWKPGEPFLEIQYEVRVIIGPADLRFELWFNGQRWSQEHSIKVEWAPSTAASEPFLETIEAPPQLPEDGVLKPPKTSLLQRMFSHTPPTTPQLGSRKTSDYI